MHHASVGIEVKFRDFAALSRWVGQHVANTDGFRVSRVEWALTSKRRTELQRQARTRAVEDAVVRAQQYADALGLGKIRPVAIADAGMLGASLHPESGVGAAHLRAAPQRPQAVRTSNCCRSTSRYRRRSTRGSSARTPRTTA